MTNIRLPAAVCAAATEVLDGSHQTLETLFENAGVPGPPPDLAHSAKWKTWLQRAGADPSVDSLAVLGRLIEEFMDLPPLPSESARSSSALDEFFGIRHLDPLAVYKEKRDRLSTVLEEHGFRYFRGGRIIPQGDIPPDLMPNTGVANTSVQPNHPSSVEELLQRLLKGLLRAMHPLEHRRRGATSLTFESEPDIQDLLHSQLRPWVSDIRPEEFTPSYAGSATRMDFLLPAHKLVIEIKRVRDKAHASKVSDELIVDIEHYRRHPCCDRLWCAVYDLDLLIKNPAGMISDLEGNRSTPDGSVSVHVLVIPRTN